MITPVAKLPEQGKPEPFVWTAEELKEATRTAMEWLFPIEGEG